MNDITEMTLANCHELLTNQHLDLCSEPEIAEKSVQRQYEINEIYVDLLVHMIRKNVLETPRGVTFSDAKKVRETVYVNVSSENSEFIKNISDYFLNKKCQTASGPHQFDMIIVNGEVLRS